MQTCTIKVNRRTVEWINALLRGEDKTFVKDGEVIVEINGRFPDRSECDIKLVSGGRTALDPEEGKPYLDPVLFDSKGRERAVLEPDRESVLGIYEWTLPDDSTYTCTVEED